MSIADEIGGRFPAQDFIVLGGQQSPGKARVLDADSPRDWDIRKGYGFSGAYAVFSGANLSKFKVEVWLWEPEHFGQWEEFAVLLEKPTPGKRPKAIGISHPLLEMPPWRITDVVVANAKIFRLEVEGDSLYICEIELLEYKPPKPVLLKPKSAIPAASKPTPTAQDAADREIESAMAELKTLVQ